MAKTLDLRQYFGHIKAKFYSCALNIIYIKLSRLDMEPRTNCFTINAFGMKCKDLILV